MRHVIEYKDPESDAFIAEVPSLPSCHSDGATAEEAIENDLIQAFALLMKPHPVQPAVAFPSPLHREGEKNRKKALFSGHRFAKLTDERKA